MGKTLNNIIGAGVLSAAALGLTACDPNYMVACENLRIEQERNDILREQNRTVYVQPQQQAQERPLLETWKDGDKKCGREIFYAGEKIMLSSEPRLTYLGESIHNQTTYLETGEKGKPVVKEYFKGEALTYSLRVNKLLELFGEGRYKNEWFVDGRKVGELRFTIYKTARPSGSQ